MIVTGGCLGKDGKVARGTSICRPPGVLPQRKKFRACVWGDLKTCSAEQTGAQAVPWD